MFTNYLQTVWGLVVSHYSLILVATRVSVIPLASSYSYESILHYCNQVPEEG